MHLSSSFGPLPAWNTNARTYMHTQICAFVYLTLARAHLVPYLPGTQMHAHTSIQKYVHTKICAFVYCTYMHAHTCIPKHVHLYISPCLELIWSLICLEHKCTHIQARTYMHTQIYALLYHLASSSFGPVCAWNTYARRSVPSMPRESMGRPRDWYVCVCMHEYIHTYIHTYIHIYIYIYIYIYICIYAR